jgi:sulfide dehydrogenase cytochrome subunit
VRFQIRRTVEEAQRAGRPAFALVAASRVLRDKLARQVFLERISLGVDPIGRSLQKILMAWGACFASGATARSVLASLLALSPGAIASDSLYTACTGCHGPGGISQAPHMPSIAGLNFRYFYASMQAFRKDLRPSSVMGRIAKGYKSGQLQRMALHYGSQRWSGSPAEVDPALAARGEVLHAEYCEKCHKENGWFQDHETPPLAGQAQGYLFYQMQDYRQPAPAMRQPPLMQERLEKLTDEDLQALSAYYASGTERPQVSPVGE